VNYIIERGGKGNYACKTSGGKIHEKIDTLCINIYVGHT